MKFRLMIDKTACEEVVATVHERSALTDKIEALVLEYTGDHELTAYRDDEMTRLSFGSIECITVIDGKTYAIDTAGKRCRLKQRLYEMEQFTATYSGGINKQMQSR